MNAPDLLCQLDKADVRIAPIDGGVYLDAPVGLLDNDLINTLRERKAEIVSFFERPPSPLREYLRALAEWWDSESASKPPSPPPGQFPERPERAIAWGQHWIARQEWRTRNEANFS